MAFEIFVVNAADGYERFVFMSSNVYKTQSWIIECEWADLSEIPFPGGEAEIESCDALLCLRRRHLFGSAMHTV